jgi:LCP family protein required for cell wall assembly
VGSLLLIAFLLLLGTAAAAALGVGITRETLEQLAVQPKWLDRATIAIVALAVMWAVIVAWSYLVVRPGGLRVVARLAAFTAVTVLCTAVATPMVYAAHLTQVYRDALTSIFDEAEPKHPPITETDPFAGRPRVNILLLGGDAASNRVGVRTDSMTLASVDTRTGNTVLISLPRNLENVPMPAGPALTRFPNGFTGDGPLDPGLLNEVFQYAENHPEIVPGVAAKRRGPSLLKATISRILGQPVDYYILVDMFGFADIIDAMGGVELNIPQAIPYGSSGGVLRAGRRVLNGKEALWYGRSRVLSDDYTRMSRQKCLMRAIARQADAQRVVTSFKKIANAAKRTLSTDIPSGLLPGLVKLSTKVKTGTKINSLQFVPPLIYTGNPDYRLIRILTARAIVQNGQTVTPTPTPSGSSLAAGGGRQGVRPTPSSSVSAQDGSGGTTSGARSEPVSLDAVCPS